MLAGGKPIVVVGSINIDLVANTDRIPVEGETVLGRDFHIHPGGKGANQAVAVARLGYPVRMIGRLGDDAFAAQLRTGLVGANSIVVVPGANALLTPQDLEANLEIIRSAGIVLTQLETPMETVRHLATLCSREGVPLMLDPAPAKELPPDLFAKVAWFTPNETEAAFFLDSGPGASDASTAASLLSKGIQGVVLKLGSRGAYLASHAHPASKTGPAVSIPPFPVNAIDTTAAGDCFNGAFATALSLGHDPAESARFAAAASAISVTRAGAQPSMPSMAEVEQLLGRKY